VNYASYITFYLIRHGKDYATEIGKFDRNSSLTPEGINQMNKVGQYLTNKKITKFFSSPLQRAIESADIISNIINISYQINELLAERNSGDANEMSFEQVRRKFSHLMDKNIFDKDWGFPNGETNTIVYTRTNQFLQNIMKDSQGISENILILSHGTPLNYIMNQLLGIGYREGLLFNINPGTISEFEQHQGYFQLIQLKQL
jgi:broad specificity phosphatase PhoE